MFIAVLTRAMIIMKARSHLLRITETLTVLAVTALLRPTTPTVTSTGFSERSSGSWEWTKRETTEAKTGENFKSAFYVNLF